MIHSLVLYGFAALAVLCMAGAWLKRTRRVTLIWAALSAAIAAISQYYHVFWPVPVVGLMTFWALFAATNAMNAGWRLRGGLVGYLGVGAIIALYPTYHDELRGPIDYDAMPAAEAERQHLAAAAGELGLSRYLLENIPFRMVRGLDLKGGMRLVYTVDVQEAIRDKRDGYYDGLRAALARSYRFHEADGLPSDEALKKLNEVVRARKSETEVDAFSLVFNDAADAKKHVNEALLGPFLGELTMLRSEDGKTISLRVKNEVGSTIRQTAVEQAKQTVNRRVDSLGVKEAAVTSRDEDIIIEIPGRGEEDFVAIQEIISQTAKLEFKLLDDDANFFQQYEKSRPDELPKGLTFAIENAPVGEGKSKPNTFARLSALEGERLEDALVRFKEWTSSLQVPQDREIGFGRAYAFDEETEELTQDGWRTYFLKSRAHITGDMVRDAQANPASDTGGLGGWVVNMDFSQKGGEIFETITGDNIKRRFAIILDGKVESAPVIQTKIGGGSAQITMGAGGVQQQLEDARKLELVLRSGALPAPISPSRRQLIGPSLGRDAIAQGVKAAGIGGLLVLAMMFLSYRLTGFIANFAVLINILLLLTVLAMFSASMTLPGLAGLALTVGMAVDANVLINERIKEELRGGKSARAAVALGYDKALSAIIDGQATTLISGLILAQYGSGPIKGFAVTLIIGLLTSVFSSVVVTRLFFDFWVRGRRQTTLSIGL